MIPLRRIFGLVCLILSLGSLVIGHAQIGQPLTLAAVLIASLVWLFARKWPSAELSAVALTISVGLAAAGLLLSASAFLMMLSATLALAAWDLTLFDHALAGSSSNPAIAQVEKKHYQSLALALGLGLLGAVAGRMISLPIPFGGMVLLVIFIFFSLNRVWRTLMG
jgi:hypothetical protein